MDLISLLRKIAAFAIAGFLLLWASGFAGRVAGRVA